MLILDQREISSSSNFENLIANLEACKVCLQSEIEKFCHALGNAGKGGTKATVMTLSVFLMKKFPRATIVSAKFIFRRKHFHPRTFRNLAGNFLSCCKTFAFFSTKGDVR